MLRFHHHRQYQKSLFSSGGDRRFYIKNESTPNRRVNYSVIARSDESDDGDSSSDRLTRFRSAAVTSHDCSRYYARYVIITFVLDEEIKVAIYDKILLDT